MVFPTRQMIFDVIGDLITNERQRKQLVVDDRIVGLLGKVPIQGRWARTQSGQSCMPNKVPFSLER
jgi:hypothetical protein